MKLRCYRYALILLLVPPAMRAQRIPQAKVESLTGAPIALPQVLQGKIGVLVLGFSRGSQQAVTDWGRKLAADYRDSPAVLYYEMPMLAGVPRLMRGLVVRQMRSSVPERAWPRFAPLTEDEKAWRSLAHYTSEEDAYVLLVDGEGNVRWQTEGPPSDMAYATLKQQISAASSQMASAERRP